ncbi:hypothetical protein CLV30_10379 [Haloactinopolyspora alba]|uniref:Uncharacterized protein n=2 Tax=Haloactinopolyspora alba TaxID=648780 RepID=A0A2P8E947_9ACTN|nr:hypothetical protein CLV30_10379 [Haloactinopolyspora alba]
MTGRGQPPHVRAQRRVLNKHWPRRPRDFRKHRPGIPVTARVVWERDGEEYIDATAVRWDTDHVYVEFVDNRLGANGTWLKPSDIYRSTPENDDRPADPQAPPHPPAVT